MNAAAAQVPATLEVGCSQCGAALSLGQHDRTAICPYCATPTVVQRPAAPDRPPPGFTVGFVLPLDDARSRVRRWITTRGPFTRSDFKRAAVDATRGVYVPAYLYGAVAHTSYSAEIGENYTTTTGSGKNRRTTTKTEWRSLSGRHASYVRDIVVTASRGVGNAELERIEPFDLRAIKRYDRGLVSGWIAEEPSMSTAECLKLARGEAHAQVMKRLDAFMPGDKHRGLQAEVTIDREVLELVLLPVWIFALKYHPELPPSRVLVNGQTGQVTGKVPVSWVKVTIAVLLLLAAVIAFFVMKGS